MKSVTKYLSCHGLTLLTGIILGVVITLSFIHRIELLCLLKSYNFWSSLGAMLAGGGTVGLLLLAYFRSREWVDTKKADVALKELQFMLNNIYSYGGIIYESLSQNRMSKIAEKNDIDAAIHIFKELEQSTREIEAQFSASITLMKGIFQESNLTLCDGLKELESNYKLGFMNYMWDLEYGIVKDLSDFERVAGEARSRASNLSMKARTLVENNVGSFL